MRLIEQRIQDYICFTALPQKIQEKKASRLTIVAHHLIHHLCQFPQTGRVEMKLSHRVHVTRFAESLGVSREWVSKLMTRLEEIGFLVRVGQERYGRDQWGPMVIRPGKWLKRKVIGLVKWVESMRNRDRVNYRSHKNVSSYDDTIEKIVEGAYRAWKGLVRERERGQKSLFGGAK